MAITLTEVWPVHKKSAGSETFTMAAGEGLGIGTTNPAVFHLMETCPEGKEWSVSIVVDIEETDA